MKRKGIIYEDDWSEHYREMTSRNLGIFSRKDQEKIRTTPIAVLGLGGLGGPLAEQLVRTGCEHLVLCDNDIFEKSNLNRQVCTLQDIGKMKVDGLEKYLLNINPDLHLKKYSEITLENIDRVLSGISIVCLTLDDIKTSILIARKCRDLNIPLIEAYGVYFTFAWWFTQKSIDYEECYGFQTAEISDLELIRSNSANLKSNISLAQFLLSLPGSEQIYERISGTIEKMRAGKISALSIAPLVRMNASYLALNVLYSGILDIKKKTLAPHLKYFNFLEDKSRELTLGGL